MRICSRTVGDSPDLREYKVVIQVKNDCTNDCNMARDNTHPCGTSFTTIKMHPVVSTQDKAEQDNISTATQQVSEQLNSDSVLPNTSVAVHRPQSTASFWLKLWIEEHGEAVSMPKLPKVPTEPPGVWA